MGRFPINIDDSEESGNLGVCAMGVEICGVFSSTVDNSQEIAIPDVASGGCSLDLVESRLWSVGTFVHDSN